MKSCKTLKGGLQEVAEQLELERVGPQHQAGSDSLLTGMAFFKMKEVSYDREQILILNACNNLQVNGWIMYYLFQMFFEDTIDDSKFSGHLYGLGTSFAVNGSNNYGQDNGENANSA